MLKFSKIRKVEQLDKKREIVEGFVLEFISF